MNKDKDKDNSSAPGGHNTISKMLLLNVSSIRNVLGTRNLGDILSEREAIASEMQQGLDSATAPWGVLVERVEVDNIINNIIFINIILLREWR